MKVVFFTGSGVSQESGVPTFRDREALWDNFDSSLLASKNAWKKNKTAMLQFHNDFRKLISQTNPNGAHNYIANLQIDHEVIIITQNVDNLHERAGSENVFHLHGNIFEARSTANHNLVRPCNGDINIGDKCEVGSQLRPNVIWFGEELDIKIIREVKKHLRDCQVLVVIGTSLEVTPAKDLILNTDPDCHIVVIDPNPNKSSLPKKRINFIEKKAVNTMPDLDYLLNNLPIDPLYL